MIKTIPNRIIISKHNQIGDVTFALPLASAIKKLYPNCYIIFIGKEYTKDLIKNYCDIDEFTSYDLVSITSLKKLNADAFIQVHPDKKLAQMAYYAKIPIRIGNPRRVYNLFYCNKFVNIKRKKSLLHESQLDLLYTQAFEKRKIYSYQEIINLRKFNKLTLSNKTNNLLDNNKFNLILHPQSVQKKREWPLKYFQKLLQILPQDKFKIFISGRAQELENIKDTISLTPNSIFLPAMSLYDFMAFIQHADGLVAASTGPLHLAANFGIRALGLYAPLKPFDATRWGPLGDKAEVISANKSCKTCVNSRQCPCMQAISPEAVKDKLLIWQQNIS